MKKKIALLLVFALMLATLAACGEKAPANRLEQIKKNGKITMSTSPDFAPSEFIDYTKTGQDQYVGADVSLGYYIAEYLGVELEIKAMDFTSALAAVTTGQADMVISGLAWKPERAENMGLSDHYDFESDSFGHGVIVPVSEAANYTSAESFSGKTLAVQAASLQLSLGQEQLPADVNYQMISNLADAIMMLKTGKVDGVISAGGTGDILIKDEPDFQFCDFIFEYESDGTVVGVPKGEDELLAEVNKAIAKAKEEDLLAGWYADAKALAESLGVE